MRPSTDTFRHKGLRQKLTDKIRKEGISDENVLLAINTIPRHFFLDSAFDEMAYQDRAFAIDAGQTISQPYTVAFQTQLLEIQNYDKVLEIGTGSGYQACVLAHLGARVYTIERQKKLHDELNEFSFFKSFTNIKSFYGDGYKGLPTFAPFDKIIITAAAPEIPPALIEQLKPNGFMVVPYGESGKSQTMKRIVKLEDGSIDEENYGQFEFVPMLTGKNQ